MGVKRLNFNQLNNKSIYLVTGAAGFVGYFLSKRLLEEGCTVIGVDNLNDYYDINLKYTRINDLSKYTNFSLYKIDLANKEEVMGLFNDFRPNIVVNLAAQAGVRYSIENPDAYLQSNLIGFHNILEACRHYSIDHLIYASSSSVYGANKKVPFEESDFVDNPVSLYAATKKSNELMAHTYSHLYNIPTTGLRFFTVYGPMGRPDMAYFGFTDKYFAKQPIQIYNNGDFENDLYRDFTYIDDIVKGIIGLLHHFDTDTPYNVYNIGNNQPVKLMQFIQTLEKSLSNALGEKVEFLKEFEPYKKGDVPATYASTSKLEAAINFKPETTLEEGLQKFANWYVSYYLKKTVKN